MPWRGDDMKDNNRHIANIEEYGLQAQGKRELVAHLEGRDLTMKKAILSKCYDCNGYYSDGKTDCRSPRCPLYPFMPYREGGPRKIREGGGGNVDSLKKWRKKKLPVQRANKGAGAK